MQKNLPDSLPPNRVFYRKKGYGTVTAQNESELCFPFLPTESVWMWFRQRNCPQAYTERSVICEGSKLKASITKWSRKCAPDLVYLNFNSCVFFISCVTIGILSTSLGFKVSIYKMRTIDSSQGHLEDSSINMDRDFFPYLQLVSIPHMIIFIVVAAFM